MLRMIRSFVLVASLGAMAACGLDDSLTGVDNVNGVGHHDDGIDPWSVLDREQREGPPRYTSRVHSCAKIRYRTLGNVLGSRGVDLNATGELDAGTIYRASEPALGGANYAARIRETVELGVAISARMFDLYIQAAPEIIASLGSTAACAGLHLFEPDGTCNRDGVTCLIGVPATQAHLDVCNRAVSASGDRELGQRVAVAALASAAHTCE